MNSQEKQAIEHARELLIRTRHAAMATVNRDGSPHNTPFFFIYDDSLKHVYWGSHPDSQHSKNIERSGQVFIVVYDSVHPKTGGLYIQAEAAHMLVDIELEVALTVHNHFRDREQKDPLPIGYYNGESPQRMYGALPVKCWVLMSQNNEAGLRIKDYRQEIDVTELLR